MPAAAVISDDEGYISNDDYSLSDDLMGPLINHVNPDVHIDIQHDKESSEKFQQQMTDNFDAGINLNLIEKETVLEHDYAVYSTPSANLLAWPYRLGHLPFYRMLNMVKRGDLPESLLDCQVPVCAACEYEKATKRPWRTQAPLNKKVIPPITGPGAVVGVDQLTSSTPGFIGQMRGILTRKRYTVSTFFVDHYSGYSYVHFQLPTLASETILAKRAFTCKITRSKHFHYHADNHIFDSKAFVEEV